ncbi:hypothetical protein D9619_005136 [Psilocybe cf. subviscida]|uniref:ATP-dependent DNA helicase n=1 Tax=Psilocybe cf. subviscida TaxID=2480587 RepID=A0A8H5BR13_9AGAR|nr:hypothetical protein D9619_005136 [Psilocybe cf. subviscida]
MVVPLDTIRMNRVIPPAISSLKDTMCAVFVGTTKPTADAILSSKTSPVLVRKSRVKTMIQFLLDRNPHYKPRQSVFEFSNENLTRLHGGEDEGIPGSVEIGFVQADSEGVIGVSTADYTPRAENAEDQANDELLMENVGYTDGDTSAANYFSMKALALERCRKKQPFIVSGTGNTAVPEFNNPSILTWLFPHLDPWGIAGFNHVGRRIKLTLDEQLSHFLRSNDKLFQRDPEFAFVFFNVVRKMNVSRSMRFSVRPSVHRQLAVDMMTIEPETLSQLGKKFQLNPLYRPTDPKEQKACHVMSSLTMIARNIPGSNGYKVQLRNQIRALIMYQGTPTIFITLNPADVDNPIVRVLTGEHISLEDISRGEDMDSWSRQLFAARNPSACAMFFHLIITNFIKVGLKFGCGPSEPGIFGVCDAYYGTVEAQGKGTLHCHMLLWLRGHLSPQTLRDAMSDSNAYQNRVFQWVESVIKCEFPVENAESSISRQPPERLRHFDLGNPHPGTIPAPSLQPYRPGEQYNWSTFNNYLSQLLYEYNWHVHNETCWKYLRRGEPRNDENCRLRMNGVTRAHTSLDPETGALLLRRHHPRIAAYNDLVTFMLKCNAEVKFIGSGRAARDLVFYITDYVTKPTLPVHIGMTALRHAISKVSDKMAQSLEGFTASVNTSAIITAVNSMMGRQEISQPQVMGYLIGGGDHYTSAKFSMLNWGEILKYVDTVVSMRGTPDGVPDAIAPLGDSPMAIDIQPDSVTASSQTLDYIFRSEHPTFESLCLYDFATNVSKSTVPKSLLEKMRIEDISGSFSSWAHPQRGSHRLMVRLDPHVPVLLGPTIPNPESSADMREKWAKCILVLFKPWRDAMQLKSQNETWLQAYNEYQAQLSCRHYEIIKNINAFSESRDARGTMPLRSAAQPVEDSDAQEMYMSGDPGASGTSHENKMADDIDGEPHTPRDIFLCTNNSHQYNELLDQIAASRIGSAVVGALDVCYESASLNQDEDLQDTSKEVTVDDLKTIISYQTFMKEQRANRGPNLINEIDSRSPVYTSRRPVIEAFIDVVTIENLESRFPKRRVGTGVKEIVNGVIEKMNLSSNPEQLRAFNLVSDHLLFRDNQQLLMYVAGVGGTGKSHVIRSIVDLFTQLGVRNQLKLGAPTGIAAVLIRGQTLHSLAHLNPGAKAKGLDKLTSAWKDVRYLIIDEVSMIGARFLSLFSNRLREARYHDPERCSTPFGGVSVIFMGDFGQLKPPAQVCLYAHSIISNPSFKLGSSVEGIDTMNGVLLWRQVTQVVTLQQNQRQAEDSEYAAYLLRIRLGACSPHPRTLPNSQTRDDWHFLLDRLIENLDPETLKLFKDAPIIVGNKVTRDTLNAKRIKAHAAELGQTVELYHSVDTIKRTTVPIGLRRGLWDIPSSDNNDSFGRLPLFAGMKVMVTENIAFSYGIVNGSEGVIQSIQYNVDGFGIRTAAVAYVHITGCNVHLAGLDPEVVPIFPVSTRIEYSLTLAPGHVVSGFTRKQLPLVPGYVYTDFKSQGRTLLRAIVDLYTARGQGVYVMLSRVKSLSGLAILRWFPPNKVYNRLPAELREELGRIHTLSVATATQSRTEVS